MFSKHDRSRPALDMNKKNTWNKVRATNNAAYVVDSNFKCVDRVTHKLGFNTEVIQAGFTLPHQMIEHNEQGAPFPVVVSYNPSFFDPAKYIKINYKN